MSPQYYELYAHHFNSIYASDYDNPDQVLQIPRALEDDPIPLTTRESVELFQETVDHARHLIQQSLAGSGKVGDALRPKLTLDLSRKRLATIPSEVVTVIKHDAERYA